MKSVLMSIRKPIADTIFKTWTKRLEYRTRWNHDFKGRVYVYESGKEGGNVAGYFDVERVIHAHYDKAVTAEDWNVLDSLDQKSFDEFFMIKAHATPSIFAIEITNVHRFDVPINLHHFLEFIAARTKIERPPQSWQYIETIDNVLLPISVPVSLSAPPEGASPTEEFMIERLKND